LVTDSYIILGRWRGDFYLQFNAPGVNDVRQTEIHTAEPLVLRSVPVRLKWLLKREKRYKSSGIDQIPAELVKAGVEQFALRSMN